MLSANNATIRSITNSEKSLVFHNTILSKEILFNTVCTYNIIIIIVIIIIIKQDKILQTNQN